VGSLKTKDETKVKGVGVHPIKLKMAIK